jgi:hypothetical protein
VALSLSALTATAGVRAAAATFDAIALEEGRRSTVAAFSTARRLAFLENRTVRARVDILASTIVLSDDDSVRLRLALPRGILIQAAPADGDVAFFAGARAENATIVLGRATAGPQRRIVVNQRGRIR